SEQVAGHDAVGRLRPQNTRTAQLDDDDNQKRSHWFLPESESTSQSVVHTRSFRRLIRLDCSARGAGVRIPIGKDEDSLRPCPPTKSRSRTPASRQTPLRRSRHPCRRTVAAPVATRPWRREANPTLRRVARARA